MAEDGPPLFRPIPRRPFNINLTSPTPPDNDDTSENEHEDLSSSQQFLSADSAVDPFSISRPGSFMNLTTSTLAGIYSPTTSKGNRILGEADTPWGTGSQTPIRRPSVDDATYELMRDRAHLHRRRSSHRSVETTLAHSRPSHAITFFALGARALILFTLGAGYSILLARFQDDSRSSDMRSSTSLLPPALNTKSLVFWGVSGLLLGCAMPWADKLWVNRFGEDEDETVAVDTEPSEAEGSTMDSALALRPIGAFVGIIFAIRKLAWASTLQVSMSLAMTNPLLWWLVDRSVVGFLVSAAAGLLGSIFLAAIDPSMMPAPPAQLDLLRNSVGNSSFNTSSEDTFFHAAQDFFPLAGISSQETIETGVWMLSVLFCSSLCFGNVGRRLAWDKPFGHRGRWGGIR